MSDLDVIGLYKTVKDAGDPPTLTNIDGVNVRVSVTISPPLPGLPNGEASDVVNVQKLQNLKVMHLSEIGALQTCVDSIDELIADIGDL